MSAGSDEAEEAARRVRQLLLSGDNTLKNREGDAAVARARESFQRALDLAREAGLPERTVGIAAARLEALDAGRDDA